MITNNSISITYFLRGKSNSIKTIYLRISKGKERLSYSLKITINPNEWDNKLGKVNSKFSTSININQYLNQIENELLNNYYQIIKNGELLNPNELILKVFSKPTQIKDDSVFCRENPLVVQMIDMYWEDFLAKYNAGLNAYNTHRCTKMIIKKFKDYINLYYVSNKLRLLDIDVQFFPKFETYLYVEKGYGNNFNLKILKLCKRIFTFSYESGWVDNLPRIKYKTKFKNPNRVVLTLPEIQRIENLIPKTNTIEEARDCAIFQCYTGLAFAELRNLKRNNIKEVLGRKWIIIPRQKTEVLCRVVIIEKVQKLIDKYKNHPYCLQNNQLMPIRNNQKYNFNLKQLMKLCDIETNISSHILRHSFATTIALSNGMSMETLSKVLGHTNLRTTEIYGKVLDSRIMEDFIKLESLVE